MHSKNSSCFHKKRVKNPVNHSWTINVDERSEIREKWFVNLSNTVVLVDIEDFVALVPKYNFDLQKKDIVSSIKKVTKTHYHVTLTIIIKLMCL